MITKGERVMPVKSVLEAPSHILKALTKAANKTGVDFEYLLKTASRESSFNKDAKATRSSAEGLFQFVENTWLGTLKEEGEKLGLAKYAEQITRTSDGKYMVPDKALRQEILALRSDPEISSLMAGAYSQKNSAFLQEQIGREPSAGELYLAHFLGPSDAVRMINLQTRQPNAAATAAFPSAAKANPAIFGDANNARTVEEVYQQLVGKHQSDVTAVASATNPSQLGTGKKGPLLSRKAISPLGNLYGNGQVKVGSSGSVWGTLLQDPTKAKSIQPTNGVDPLAWAAGRSLNGANDGGKHEAWVGEQGWKVKVKWVTPMENIGKQKNLKT